MPRDAQQPGAGYPGTPGGDDPARQGSKRSRLGAGRQAGRQPQAGAWEGGGRPRQRKDVIYLISRSTMERMEEKNNLGARHLAETLSGAERHQAMPKQAGKLNWDESPGASSVHLSRKPATNPEKTCFPAPRVAILSLSQLCRKVIGFKTGLLFLFPHTKDGNVAAERLSAGVMTSHRFPSGDGDPAVGCRSQDSWAGPILGCPAGLRVGAGWGEAGRRRPGMLQHWQDGMPRAEGTQCGVKLVWEAGGK